MEKNMKKVYIYMHMYVYIDICIIESLFCVAEINTRL